MRLVRFRMNGFRRFESADVNLDAPVVALVGPNEAGKTSLLNALVQSGMSGAFNERDITRDYTPQGNVLEALYRLDDEDRASVEAISPGTPPIHWFRAWRARDGSLSYETIPTLPSTEVAPSHNQAIPQALALIDERADRIPSKLIRHVSGMKETQANKASDYTDTQLAQLDQLAKDLAEHLAERGKPGADDDLEQIPGQVSDFVKNEKRRRLPAYVTSLLRQRVPTVLEFVPSARTLASEHDLQKSWPNGLSNLARLGGFRLQELRTLAEGTQPERHVGLLRDAERRINTHFEKRWKQAKVEVLFDIVPPARLRIFVKADGGGVYRLQDRSDGLRAFVALVAFLAKADTKTRPIIVVDEAEGHLHWDAQADLIRLFHAQDIASQIIYATHSPGCLPHDLGGGVRAVVPSSPDRSHVTNWIWQSDAGYRPLLLAMGASAAALTPHRFAVATEGVSDFILMPSLLRDATGQDPLPYQVVPGLAQLARGDIARIDGESDAVIYLTDGDTAGKKIHKQVRGSGVPESRIVQLPDGMVLEDFVAAHTLTDAVFAELRPSGCTSTEDLSLPARGRSAAIEAWCASKGLPKPGKRALASRVLDLTADNAKPDRPPLTEEDHRPILQEIHNNILAGLWPA